MYRKKKSLSLELLESEEKDISSLLRVEENIENEAEAKYVIEMIEKLDEKYRDVIYLRFVEEMKPKEIAEVLGESSNVVSVRINRGLEQLRALLHLDSHGTEKI